MMLFIKFFLCVTPFFTKTLRRQLNRLGVLCSFNLLIPSLASSVSKIHLTTVRA